MSRMLQSSLLALALVGFCSDSAQADWFGHPWFSSYSSSYYSSYYYPTYSYSYYPVTAPVYYYVQPAPYACPVPVVQQPVMGGGYAQPSPAPPSTTQEPPLFKKMDPPQVNESRSFSASDGKSAASGINGNGKELYKVGFWNVSGRDVTVTVNGAAYTIPRDRNLTLSVGRAFRWQVDGKESQADKVPDDSNSHEIVIR